MAILHRNHLIGLLSITLMGLHLHSVPSLEELNHESPRSLIQEGFYARALDALVRGENCCDEDLQLFQKAYCLQQLERWEEAVVIYRQLLERGCPLDEYLFLFLATCLVPCGDFPGAEKYLRRLLDHQGSLLECEARELLGEIYLRWARPEEAMETYRALAEDSRWSKSRPRFWYQQAIAARQAGRADEAAGILMRIIADQAASREALPALDELLAIRDGFLNGVELYQAGWVYYHRGRYDQSIEIWDRFLERDPPPGLVPEVLFLTAKACYLDKRFSEAQERCGRLLDGHPRSEWVTSAKYLQARCAEGEGFIEEAIEQYRCFVADYAWSQLADDALRQITTIFERRGDLASAEREYWNLSQRYASRQNAAMALWRAGLYAILRGDDETALSRLSQLIGHQAGASLLQGSLYWIGRIHLRAGRLDQGTKILEEVIQRDENSYYAQRSRELLAAPSASTVDSPVPIANVLLENESSPGPEPPAEVRGGLERGEFLLRAGLLSRAREELSGVHAVAHEYPHLVVDLLRFYRECQLYGDALRLAQTIQVHMPGSNIADALQPYLYPRSYLESVLIEAEKYDLDPYLILALMRVESLFDPLAVSGAGALGLMQVMPATGNEIAQKLGMPAQTAMSFFDPHGNIRLGAYYLWQQHQSFNGQVEFALAAYNAGPGNVSRWLRRLGDIDPELFVELIDYQETRLFVKKVLATHARYRRIWGDGR